MDIWNARPLDVEAILARDGLLAYPAEVLARPRRRASGPARNPLLTAAPSTGKSTHAVTDPLDAKRLEETEVINYDPLSV